MHNYHAAEYYFAYHLIYVKLTLIIIFPTLNSVHCVVQLRRLRTKEKPLDLGCHSEKWVYGRIRKFFEVNNKRPEI